MKRAHTSPSARTASGPGVRYAVIFIPGKGTALLDQSLEAVCDRLLVALADSGTEGNFAIGQPQHIRFGPANRRTCRRRSLVRTLSGKAHARLDVYGVEYASDISQDYTSKPLILKCLKLFQTVFAFLRYLLPALRHHSSADSTKKSLQMLLAVILALLVGTYAVVLMLILAYQAVKAVRPDLHLIPDFVSSILLVLAAIGFASLTTRLQQLIDAFVGDYVFMMEYFGRGRHQEQLRRQVSELVNYVNVSERYDDVTILAYSFGAILAIDCLFPSVSTPEMHVSRVDGLLTIGCPLDIMRSFWPTHYVNRRSILNPPRRWINFYSPRDVLSSIVTSRVGPQCEELSAIVCDNIAYPEGTQDKLRWTDVLRLQGVIAHSSYWGEAAGEAGCFGLVVSQLYKGTDLMA
jgi:hypothetical protein